MSTPTEPFPTNPAEPAATSPHNPTDNPGATKANHGSHPVNIAHLVLGVVFVGLALVWALITSDAVALHDVRWLLPIPWIAAGVAGLVAIAVRARRHPNPTTMHTEETR